MTWAVHNIHTPAVQIDDAGCYSLGGPPLKFGEPIFTAPTKQEAEAERLSRRKALEGYQCPAQTS